MTILIIRIKRILFFTCICVLIPHLAVAEYVIPQQVSANGGNHSGNSTYQIISTIGQSSVGIGINPQYHHEVGFWYQPKLSFSTIELHQDELADRFALSTTRSNPGRYEITFIISVPHPAHIILKLYDITGRNITTLADQRFESGFHEIALPPGGLASGVYFCRMVTGNFTETRRLVMIR